MDRMISSGQKYSELPALRATGRPYRWCKAGRRGPYRLWIHQHTFFPTDAGTTIRDHVTYAVYGGRLVQRLFVGGQIEQIFDYRRQKLQ